MVTLEEAKLFLRIDDGSEDVLLTSLIGTAKELTQAVLRKNLDEYEVLPATIKQAMLIITATLYEERQVSGDNKNKMDIVETLDLVRRMLFAYREDKY